jgi:Mg2+ and Co2+ transporter CorA
MAARDPNKNPPVRRAGRPRAGSGNGVKTMQQDLQAIVRQIISILDEISSLLTETVKLANQGKLRTLNQHHQWRYGTIIDRVHRAIQKISELKKLVQDFMGHHDAIMSAPLCSLNLLANSCSLSYPTFTCEGTKSESLMPS